jgi:hypothetical protein
MILTFRFLLRVLIPVSTSDPDKDVRLLSLFTPSSYRELGDGYLIEPYFEDRLTGTASTTLNFDKICSSATYADVRPPTVIHLIVAGLPDGLARSLCE